MTRITFISKGFRDVLFSDGVKDIVTECAERIQKKAGADFEAETWRGGYGGGRWVATVRATNSEGMRAEAEQKVLSKAVMG